MDKTRIARLVHAMNNAPDFGYDDEAVELNSLLRPVGKAWKWERDSDGRERVVTYNADGQGR